jgi:hypothetical protein
MGGVDVMENECQARSWSARQQRAGRARAHRRMLCSLGMLIGMLAVLLAGCASSAQSAAAQNKAKLDTELRHAQSSAGIPPELLQPILAQESTLAANVTNGTDKNGQAAAEGYATLYNQVVALEKMTPDEIRQHATLDLQSFSLALQHVLDQRISVAATFALNYKQAQQQLGAAQTAKELFTADGYILDQSAAVSQIIPVYQEMQALDALVAAQSKALGSTPAAPLQCAQADSASPSFYTSDAQMLADAGLNPKNGVMVGGNAQYTFSSWPSQNQAAFQAARDSADFGDLSATVLAETSQLAADGQALLPQQTAAAVAAFQADVQTYTKDGGKDTTYQWEASQDAQALATPTSLADLSALSKTVAKQRQDFAFPFIKVKAPTDMQALTNLVLQANKTTIYDSYDGVSYPIAYEYIGFQYRYGRDWAGDPQDGVDTREGLGGQGIGDARLRLLNAHTLRDYTAVETEIQMFTQNVTALIADFAQMPKDGKAREAWSMTAHQTDLDLINYYGLQNTRVIVVSFAEQKARLYEGGKLAAYTVTSNSADAKLIPDSKERPDAFDVTTGSPDLPSLPGMHCVMPIKIHDYEDVAPDSLKGTPFWYAPTPIHFGFPYASPGYFLHDAWWRDNSGMGYLSNLPHYDPLAFNGGSHGCINLHYVDYATGRYDMAIVYAFAQEGTPIIVY